MAATPDLDSLDGSSWILAELPPEPLLDNVMVTLAFEAGRVAGSDGCNRFRGAYTLSDGELRIGNFGSTMMACPEPVMHQAQVFTDALDRVRGGSIEDGTLYLFDANGATLARFRPQPRELADTRWTVTGYNNGKQAVVSMGDAALTLEFDTAGAVRGSAGCNDFGGEFSADGRSFGVTAVTAGNRTCATDVMERETAFLEALRRSTRRHMEADRLELRDDEGALQIVAVRVED